MLLKKNALIVLVLALCCCREVQKEESAKTAPIVPAAERPETSLYVDLEGNPVALSHYQGKRILLNYWATWCAPCIEEMPALLKLQRHLENHNYVFLFASDEALEKIMQFKENKGFNFTYLKYNGNYAEQGISALPVTLIINEEGAQIARFDGGMAWNGPEMIDQLIHME